MDEMYKRCRDKLDPLREKKLNEIGFVWDKYEDEWHAMFCALKRFKEREGRWPRHQKQRTSERWCWQMANQC